MMLIKNREFYSGGRNCRRLQLAMASDIKLQALNRLTQEVFSCGLSEMVNNVAKIYRGLGSPDWKCRACCLSIIKDYLNLDKNETVQIAKAKVNDHHPQVAKIAWMIIGKEFAGTYDDEISVFCAKFISNEGQELSSRHFAYRCLELVRHPKSEFTGQFDIDDLAMRFQALKDSISKAPQIDWELISSILNSKKP